MTKKPRSYFPMAVAQHPCPSMIDEILQSQYWRNCNENDKVGSTPIYEIRNIYTSCTRIVSETTTKKYTFVFTDQRNELLWGFPKLGLPPVTIHFGRIFHSKPIQLLMMIIPSSSTFHSFHCIMRWNIHSSQSSSSLYYIHCIISILVWFSTLNHAATVSFPVFCFWWRNPRHFWPRLSHTEEAGSQDEAGPTKTWRAKTWWFQ